MRSRITATGSLVLAAALLAGTASVVGGQSPSAAPASMAPASAAPRPSLAAPTTLITPGTLTACVDIEYPPMEYFPSADVTDANAAIGFDVDGARAVAAALGLGIEIRNTSFDGLIPDLTAGRCDIVWSGLYINETRLEVADAVPYMTTGHVVMVPAGNPAGIAEPADLCGKAVAIQSGGLVEERINALSAECTAGGGQAITIQGYKQVADELQQIMLGRVDAIWETDSAVSWWMIQNPDQFEVAYALPRDDTYGIYYLKGNTELGDALAAAVRALKADGTLVAIAERYQIDPATLDVIE
jgi:ABC-type amino acid transport substrate-binding protein